MNSRIRHPGAGRGPGRPSWIPVFTGMTGGWFRVLAVWVALHGSAVAAGFTFAAFGDLPYNAEEEKRFVGLIAELNREPLAFVVHIGDIKAAVQPCSDELFLQRKEWFALVRYPLVLLPGDNEWTDCKRLLSGSHDP